MGQGAAEHRLQQIRDDGLADGADPDRGQRDPHLAGGDVLVDVVDLLERQRGAAQPLLLGGLELRPARAYERVLRDHEERVDEHQDEDCDEQ